MSDIIKEWKEKQVQDGLRSPDVHTCVDRPNLSCLACKLVEEHKVIIGRKE